MSDLGVLEVPQEPVETSSGAFDATVHAISGITEGLHAEFRASFDRQTIHAVVGEVYARVAGRARYAMYVPLLTKRFAREELLRRHGGQRGP